MAPDKEQTVLVDWSCSECTRGAQFPQKGPHANKSGHLNYKGDKHCRKCKTPKGECHLCAYSDLGQKLKDAQNPGGYNDAAGSPKNPKGKGKGADAAGKGKGNSGGKSKREKELEKETR